AHGDGVGKDVGRLPVFDFGSPQADSHSVGLGRHLIFTPEESPDPLGCEGFFLGTENDADFFLPVPSGDPIGGKAPANAAGSRSSLSPLQDVPPTERSSLYASDFRPDIGGFAPHHVFTANPAGHRQISPHSAQRAPEAENAAPLQHKAFPQGGGNAVHRRPQIGPAQSNDDIIQCLKFRADHRHLQSRLPPSVAHEAVGHLQGKGVHRPRHHHAGVLESDSSQVLHSGQQSRFQHFQRRFHRFRSNPFSGQRGRLSDAGREAASLLPGPSGPDQDGPSHSPTLRISTPSDCNASRSRRAKAKAWGSSPCTQTVSARMEISVPSTAVTFLSFTMRRTRLTASSGSRTIARGSVRGVSVPSGWYV